MNKRKRWEEEEEEGSDAYTYMVNNDDEDMEDAEEAKNNTNVDGIYVCTTGGKDDDGGLDWYYFNRNTEGVGVEGLSSVPLLRDFSCCGLGEEIYFFGGYNGDYECVPITDQFPAPISNGVMIFNSRTKKWRKGVPMLAYRQAPRVVSFPPGSRKPFYVFGSVHGRGDYKPWAEYYDSKLNKWKKLPNIPSKFQQYLGYSGDIVLGHAIVPNRERIVLWSFSYFALFNIRDNTWVNVVSITPYMREEYVKFTPNIAVTDGVLYWYYGNSLFAYDFMDDQKNNVGDPPIFTFDNLWDGPDVRASDSFSNAPHLIATGNNELCLIWYERHVQQICYTYFLLHHQQGEQRRQARWTGTFNLLPLKKDYEVYDIHCCFRMVSFKDDNGQRQIFTKEPQVSGLRRKVQKNDYMDSKFILGNTDEKEEISLENLCNTISCQIFYCRDQMDEKEKELRRIMLYSSLPVSLVTVNLWKDESESEPVYDFLAKHKQDCAIMFLEKANVAAALPH